jgi:putative peptide zinc metalloprotease protein
VTASEPFLSATWHIVARLKPRLQPHAEISRHRARGKTSYIVRNPATGRTYRFSPGVYLLLGLFDGERTVDQAWSTAAARLDEAAPTQDQTIRLLSQLHEADLIHSESVPDAAEMMERRARLKRSQWVQSFGNPLAARVRLWDPDRFLDRTLPWVRPFTGPLGVLVWLIAVVPALVLAGEHWRELTGGISDRLLATENLLLLAAIFPVIKALHELGHAYAVKAGGGEVHEMGLMFLVLVPVPYVDATAANTFRSKWRRAGVGAAGMLVETFLAAIMMQVWLLVEPGMIRAIAFNIMLIAGISTVVLNGNPLLRFDGYFILCDLTATPNLSARASRYWGWLVQRIAFGQTIDPEPATWGERALFLFYAPASAAYRILITVVIALLVASRFLVFGALMAIWGIGATLVWPVCRWAWHVVASPTLSNVRRRAIAVTGGFVAVVLALTCLVPVPLHTVAEGVIWLPEKSLVRAGGEGFVQQIVVAPGQIVEAGVPLLVSADPELTAQIAVGRERIAGVEARLSAEAATDRSKAAITRLELEIERQALARDMERVDELRIDSPMRGQFIVPRAEDLPGRFHRRGEVLGYVVPTGSRIARVIVRQEDVGLVRLRVRGVDMKVAQDMGPVWHASVVREVPEGTQDFPSTALMVEGGGSQAADTRDPQHAKALRRLFQFDIELPPEAAQGAWGGHVWVRFDHGDEPLAQQWWRRLRQLFLSRFDA